MEQTHTPTGVGHRPLAVRLPPQRSEGAAYESRATPPTSSKPRYLLRRAVENAANSGLATKLGLQKTLMKVAKGRHLLLTSLVIAAIIIFLARSLTFSAHIGELQDSPVPAHIPAQDKSRRNSAPQHPSEQMGEVMPLSNKTAVQPIDYGRLIETSCREKAMGAPVCPSLFVIGAQKAGTTTLADWLMLYDLICPGKEPSTGQRIKEMRFFTRRNLEQAPDTQALQEKTWNGYLQKFPRRESTAQVGLDSTPDYIHSPSSAIGMIRSGVYQPTSRFILVLRDPVDRAVSLFEMSKRDYNVVDMEGRGDLLVFNDKYNWNFSAIAHECIPLVSECRLEAKQMGHNPFTHCMGNHRTSKVECQMFHRGFYADQLQSWLDAGFETSNFCVIDIVEMSKNAHATAIRRAGNCLRDVGLEIAKLPTIPDRPENVGNYSSIDDRHPGLRESLNSALYDDGRREMDGLLQKHFPSWTK